MLSRLSALLLFTALLGACTASGGSQTDDTVPSASSSSLTGGTLSPDDALHYHCRGVDFTAQFSPERMELWLQGKHYSLAQVRSGSGVRYAAGDVEFFGKGREGMLQVGDIVYTDCLEGVEPDPLR